MPFIEVDPAVLGQVANRLLESVEVAHQVTENRDSLKALIEDAGHEGVRAAIGSFLDRWAYGCECLTEDALQVADRLAKTSKLYIKTEETIVRAASGGE